MATKNPYDNTGVDPLWLDNYINNVAPKYSQIEANTLHGFGFGRINDDDPNPPQLAWLNAVYYTRVQLNRLDDRRRPGDYSAESILNACAAIGSLDDYVRLAEFLIVRGQLSDVDQHPDHFSDEEVAEAIEYCAENVQCYYPAAVVRHLLENYVPPPPPPKRMKFLWSTDTIDAEAQSFTSRVVDKTAASAPVPETTFGRCGVFDENHERAEAEQEHVHRPPSDVDNEEGEKGKQQFEEAHADNGESQI